MFDKSAREDGTFARRRYAGQGPDSPRPPASRVVAENRQEDAVIDVCTKRGSGGREIAFGQVPSADVVYVI